MSVSQSNALHQSSVHCTTLMQPAVRGDSLLYHWMRNWEKTVMNHKRG